MQIVAIAHVEENFQTEFHLEKSNLLEFVSFFSRKMVVVYRRRF